MQFNTSHNRLAPTQRAVLTKPLPREQVAATDDVRRVFAALDEPPMPNLPLKFATACIVVVAGFAAFAAICWLASLAFGVQL